MDRVLAEKLIRAALVFVAILLVAAYIYRHNRDKPAATEPTGKQVTIKRTREEMPGTSESITAIRENLSGKPTSDGHLVGLSCTMHSTEGNPIASSRVQLVTRSRAQDQIHSESFTDVDGRVHLPHTAVELSSDVIASAPKHKARKVHLDPSVRTKKQVTIALERGSEIVGRVVDGEGLPAPRGVTVLAWPERGPSCPPLDDLISARDASDQFFSPDLYCATTSDGGPFRFEELDEQRTYTLAAGGKGISLGREAFQFFESSKTVYRNTKRL